jgi:hypothetical protein
MCVKGVYGPFWWQRLGGLFNVKIFARKFQTYKGKAPPVYIKEALPQPNA